MLDLKFLFDAYDAEHLRFDLEESPLHPLRDVCAFLLLNQLSPCTQGPRKMVTASAGDEIFLNAKVEDVASRATEQQVITLIRCGVRLDNRYDCFAMFL